MRVLLDECLPRGLRRDLPGHEVRTVPEAGWAGKTNGELLELAEGTFDAFVTVDRGLAASVRAGSRRWIIVRLTAVSNRVGDLRPLMHPVLEALRQAPRGAVVRIP